MNVGIRFLALEMRRSPLANPCENPVSLPLTDELSSFLVLHLIILNIDESVNDFSLYVFKSCNKVSKITYLTPRLHCSVYVEKRRFKSLFL